MNGKPATGQFADRPRERLVRLGVSALSERELLALVLRSGAFGCGALEIAGSVIERFGTMTNLIRADVFDLAKVNGIGVAKASSIVAAMALGARSRNAPSPKTIN